MFQTLPHFGSIPLSNIDLYWVKGRLWVGQSDLGYKSLNIYLVINSPFLSDSYFPVFVFFFSFLSIFNF